LATKLRLYCEIVKRQELKRPNLLRDPAQRPGASAPPKWGRAHFYSLVEQGRTREVASEDRAKEAGNGAERQRDDFADYIDSSADESGVFARRFRSSRGSPLYRYRFACAAILIFDRIDPLMRRTSASQVCYQK
jgi:hypothetical protein